MPSPGPGQDERWAGQTLDGPFPGPRSAFPEGNRWAAWAEGAGAVGHPQPPPRRGYGYPQGPGFAPAPHDDPGDPGYPAGTGYAPPSGYAHDLDYVQDPGYPPGYGPDDGYPAEPGYQQDWWGPDGQGYPPEPAYPAETGYPAGSGYAAEAGYPAGTWHPRHQGQAPGRRYPDDIGAAPPVRPLPYPAEPGHPRENSDSLTPESLLHGKRSAPGSGWRRGVYRMTGGLLRVGESAAEMRRRDLTNRVRTPVAGGHHRVAVLSLKGGVGKTTTAVGLGATLAAHRGDRVIAVDANPDRGTLSDKVRLETAATIRDLLNERDQIRRYADVRAFTSQAPSRLEVLASDRDPAVSVAFGAEDYCDAARVLEHFYSICITDCGTGLLHSAMSGVLRLADQIIVVSSPSVDGARSASATLDWLEAHNCGDLVRNGVVVLSAIRPKSKSAVDLDRLEHHFAARCRAVARIPYDPHLEEGAEVELELLRSETADAYLALAAIIGDGLACPRRLIARTG
ncbi:MAG: AAA family ATPase [Streptosporangiaceae bacterium]|nr:AAA family ATPase [Streptosporangiaceae bacterium]